MPTHDRSAQFVDYTDCLVHSDIKEVCPNCYDSYTQHRLLWLRLGLWIQLPHDKPAIRLNYTSKTLFTYLH